MDRLYVFTANGPYDVVWRSAQELCDNGELIDVILAGEEGLPLQHFGEDAASTPYVDLDIVFLPGQHDLGGSIVSRRHVACHLGVLDPSQAKIADLEIAVLVHKDVAGLEVSVHDAGGVHVFQSTQNLVEEILDELLLERPRGKETV